MFSTARSRSTLILTVLGVAVAAPVSLEALPNPGVVMATVAPRISAVKSVPQPVLDSLRLRETSHPYTYIFSGKATCQKQTCSTARVEIRLTSKYNSEIRHAQAASDGTYRVAIDVLGAPDQTVSWEINAVNENYEQLNLSGHQIMMDENSIQLDNALHFDAI